MLGRRPEELLNLQGNEATPLVRKLNAFTEKVREDIEKRRIGDADGRKLILKATMAVNMLTKT